MDPISDILGDKNKFFPPEPSVPSFSNTLPKTPEPLLEPQKATEELNIDLMRITLYKMKDQLDILLHLLEGKTSLRALSPSPTVNDATPLTKHEKAGTILEGYFNGEKMISDTGEVFDIPQNYASKSKLVEGDRMKLTITDTGSFLYKQIKPIERQRIRGELVSGGSNGQWVISSPLGEFKVLTASVTFHKGRIGDEVILLIPASGHSEWGAIEHIIHKELI